MNKKYLKGFSKFTLFPITKNTADEYAVDAGIAIPYVQSLSKDIDSSETDIHADDDIYAKEKTFNGENFTLTLAELGDELRPYLEGGVYNEDTKEYDFSTLDEAPEFACTYRGLMGNGNYKMFRQYRAKVSKIKVDLNTKGNGNSASVSVEGTFMGRAYDNKLITTKESTKSEDLIWLDTIPAVTGE